jgi:hypothetical protein
MFDGDPSDANYQSSMNYVNSFAFKDFILERKKYEFSDIDMTKTATMDKDYFTNAVFC